MPIFLKHIKDTAGHNIDLPATTTKLEYHNTTIQGFFNCGHAKITTLEGAPSYIGDSFYCSHTKITSLHDVHKQIKYIGDTLYLPNTVRSHILGIMFIKGLKRIKFISSNGTFTYKHQAEAIINKHLEGNRNPHEVQEELIDAGLSEYAKL